MVDVLFKEAALRVGFCSFWGGPEGLFDVLFLFFSGVVLSLDYSSGQGLLLLFDWWLNFCPPLCLVLLVH